VLFNSKPGFALRLPIFFAPLLEMNSAFGEFHAKARRSNLSRKEKITKKAGVETPAFDLLN
jgi:hypothetical protein